MPQRQIAGIFILLLQSVEEENDLELVRADSKGLDFKRLEVEFKRER